MKSHSGKKKLAANTLMLYLLTFSNYFFSFISVPYQTRILGPTVYGILGFAFSMMVYFQLFLDFGFMLSGTAEITVNKEDNVVVSKICTSIFAAKLILFLLLVIILIPAFLLIPQIKENVLIFGILLVYTFLNSMLPDFLYRGMEEMTPITIRTILVKFIFTLGIFIFVKSPQDYLWIPILYLLGSLVALIFAFFDIRSRFKFVFQPITLKNVFKEIQNSFPFFVSRIASTIYGATNTVILGLKYSGQSILGYYSSADKIVSLARTGSSPVADSLYPYMVRNKDYKMINKILALYVPFIVIIAILIYLFAPQLCVFLFGSDYIDASIPLRALIPVIVVILPSYIYGFPMMTPLGIAKYANLSVELGALLQILLLILLWILNNLNITAICVATSITETVVFAFRFIMVNQKLKCNIANQ